MGMPGAQGQQKDAQYNPNAPQYPGNGVNPAAAAAGRQRAPSGGAASNPAASNPAAQFARQMMPNGAAGNQAASGAQAAQGAQGAQGQYRNSRGGARAQGVDQNGAPRTSFSGFLNEMGDIGRISDIDLSHMNQNDANGANQGMDELWRMSDTMNRLSL